MTPRAAFTGAAVAIVGLAGFATAQQLDVLPLSATQTETVLSVASEDMGCNDWPVQLTQGECQAAGTIRFVGLYNLQGAAQFCKWRAANPGEWSRLKLYAQDPATAASVVTWLGGAIRNLLEAYHVTGAPSFTIAPNTAPNSCRTPLPPPIVSGVAPGQTDATVTVTTGP